jgi:S1-C subfamily serine protease
MIKRIGLVFALVISFLVPTAGSAVAAVTWSQTSKIDVVFDGKFYNSQYDLQYTSAYIFDNETDKIFFYLDFLQVPNVKMFNDKKESFASIKLDYDFDGNTDVSLYTENLDLNTSRVAVTGYAYNSVTDKNLNCPVGVFADIQAQSKWVGFTVSRSCLNLPNSFNLFGVARFDSLNREDSYDFAPSPAFKVTLPTTSVGNSNSSSTTAASGATYALPSNKLNSSTSANSYSDSPQDLSKLSETLLPSVVTVKCLTGSGTGWSADTNLSSSMQSAGFLSLILTNHHVIADCLGTKSVTISLSNGASIPGSIVSWNEDLDVAGIAVKTVVPSLQWIGPRPKQGWWVGVLGSPLGTSGILTTGIISSVNSIAETFTFTAAINPGNSGGPVFDSTGRVLGLATSKRLISIDTIAEGFGSAQGTPLLCKSVIECTLEKTPWGATPKYSAGQTASELALAAAAKIAQDKALADAKAAAETAAKIAQDKANAENRLISEQLARLQGDYSTLSENFSSNLAKYTEAMAQVIFLQNVVKTLQTQVEELLKPKPETIVCTKGSVYKIVKSIAPKCPVGYKKK